MALRGDRPPIGLTWIVTWPLSAVLAATVFLSASELHHSFRSTEPAAPVETSSEWNARLPARIAVVDGALRKSPLHLGAPIEEDRGAGPLRFKHRLYEIQLTRADQARAEAAIEAVRGADSGVVLHTVQNADDTSARASSSARGPPPRSRLSVAACWGRPSASTSARSASMIPRFVPNAA